MDEALANSLPTLLTAGEVADLLRISRATLDRWTRGGAFVAPIQVGGATLRFDRDEVFAFLAQRRSNAPLAIRQRKAQRRVALKK